MRVLSSADLDHIEWQKNIFWSVRDGEKPIGFCSLKPLTEESTVYFSYSVIDKKYRGKGIQKKLIRSRLSWASRHGYSYAITETLKNNWPSITNLLRCGFHRYIPYSEWSYDALYFQTKIRKR